MSNINNMKRTYLHRPNLVIKSKFSSETVPIFRYYLEITKNDTSQNFKTVCAIMQNPSYANNDIADKSVQVLERVIFEKNLQEFKGVNRLVIVNQFAFIQTNNFLGNNEQIGNENNYSIQKAIDESSIILIAWGKDNDFLERKDIILAMINNKEKIILQTSMHPSRVRYKGFIQRFKT